MEVLDILNTDTMAQTSTKTICFCQLWQCFVWRQNLRMVAKEFSLRIWCLIAPMLFLHYVWSLSLNPPVCLPLHSHYNPEAVITFFLQLRLENVIKEGKRLQDEADNLAPITIGNHSIKCVGHPTMCDGKVKSIWAGNHLMSRCYLCMSGMTTHNFHLSKRRSKHFKVKNRHALRYGFSPLHVRLRSLDWFLKCYTYGAFKYHEARG